MPKKASSGSPVSHILKDRVSKVYDIVSRLEKDAQKFVNETIDKQTYIPADRRKQLKSVVSLLKTGDFASKAEKTRAEVIKTLEDGLGKALMALDIATKKELKTLGKKLDQLSAEIHSLKGKSS